MIFDCTLFHDEFDMLEFRLRQLSEKVDYFVIAEADTTFSNLPKPLHLENLPTRYEAWAEKIIYVSVSDMPKLPNPWVKEIHQRNAVLRGLTSAKANDLILLSDIDEIPNLAEIEGKVPDDNICGLKQRLYYYYFNLRCGDWSAASACLFKNLVLTPQEARNLHGRPIIPNAGWHFSYLMEPSKIANKINAFSHQELNQPRFVDLASIEASMKQRKDLYGRSLAMKIEQLDDSFPSELITFPDRYSDFVVDE